MPATDRSCDRYQLDATLDFMRLLWSIEHGLQKRSKRMKAEHGITGPQRLVVRVVNQFPGISAGDLARLVKLHPSTITGILQRLVTARLIRREPHPDDSRRVRLWMTRRAARHAQASSGTVESTVRGVLQRARPSDVKRARAVLAELARHLSE
jgi:MarR family transcriptional regulator, organic hydroperoxide resistance regulator